MNQIRSKVQITFTQIEEPPSFAPETTMRGPWWAWATLLAIVSIASFAPALLGTFLPQDDANVTENLFLRSWHGLRGIWRFAYLFRQFSPLGYSTLLVEYRIWGGVAKHAASGYHLVNLILHIVNVLLLWTLLIRCWLIHRCHRPMRIVLALQIASLRLWMMPPSPI